MIKRKKGFTIIELLMTMAVAALLFALAAPQYIHFANQQDFAARAGQMISCLQKAQQEATAPSTASTPNLSTRYSEVVIAANGTDITCSGGLYTDGQGANATFPTVKISNIQMQQLEANMPYLNAPVPNPLVMPPTLNSLTIRFGVIEKGAPIYFNCNLCSNPIYSSTPADPTGNSSPRDVNSGKGFPISLIIAHPLDSSITKGRVMVSQLGVPIHYEQMVGP